MLKIKDNVDLKELEKYGFEHEYDYWYKYIEDKEIENENNNFFVTQIQDNRKIHFIFYNDKDLYEFDTLYDLIKDNLVEKVEE